MVGDNKLGKVGIGNKTGTILRDVPITVPVMNPTYYGHQIFSDMNNNGVVPQQKFVFATPAGRVNAGYMPRYQPFNYKFQPPMNMVTCESFPTQNYSLPTRTFETAYLDANSMILPMNEQYSNEYNLPQQHLSSVHDDYRYKCRLNPLSCCHGFTQRSLVDGNLSRTHSLLPNPNPAFENATISNCPTHALHDHTSTTSLRPTESNADRCRLVDSSVPGITSVPLAVEASSNSLPVNGNTTPGDRGVGEGRDWTSGGPAADLREAEGEVNRRADGRTSTGEGEWTSNGKELSGHDGLVSDSSTEVNRMAPCDGNDNQVVSGKKNTGCSLLFNCCGHGTYSNAQSRVNSINDVAREMSMMSLSESVPGFGSVIPSLQYLGPNKYGINSQSFSWYNPMGTASEFYNAPMGSALGSISHQPSIEPSLYNNTQGCFNTCWGGVRNFCGNTLNTLPSQQSLGLRNLYQTPITQRSMVSHGPCYVDHYVPELFLTPQQSIVLPNDSNKFVQPPLRPNNFRLHAVEIHQYVPIPNMPSSRFVHGYNPSLHQHQQPNFIFNPNTTGPVAPMMNNVVNGVCNYHVPEMYSMVEEGDAKVERLQTQESRLTTRNEDDVSELVVNE